MIPFDKSSEKSNKEKDLEDMKNDNDTIIILFVVKIKRKIIIYLMILTI